MLHDLKTWPVYYRALVEEGKNFEIRKNDRGFKKGDQLRLREYDPVSDTYTGRFSVRAVAYVMSGETWGLEPGFCCMALTMDRNPRVMALVEAARDALAGSEPAYLPESMRQLALALKVFEPTEG